MADQTEVESTSISNENATKSAENTESDQPDTRTISIQVCITLKISPEAFILHKISIS